mmetsp:Transcript_19600/g.16743  ORF Transcript_19600/g.16743 Transcript_19600/m.16743 type:complete len:97 (+) Transcript_19600:181-471(+)
MTSLKDNLRDIILDSADLYIKQVRQTTTDLNLFFQISDKNQTLGNKLHILLPHPLQKQEKTTIRIYYKTSTENPSIGWLAPCNTAGKKHPFMYTQF